MVLHKLHFCIRCICHQRYLQFFLNSSRWVCGYLHDFFFDIACKIFHTPRDVTIQPSIPFIPNIFLLMSCFLQFRLFQIHNVHCDGCTFLLVHFFRFCGRYRCGCGYRECWEFIFQLLPADFFVVVNNSCSWEYFYFISYQIQHFVYQGKKLLLKTPWVFNSHLMFSQKCDDSKTEFKEKF